MSNATVDTSAMPLGVGNIIGETFSIFFKNIIKIATLAFVPSVLALIVSGLSIGWGMTFGTADPLSDPGAIPGPGFGLGILVSTIFSMIAYGLTIGLLVQLAYDAKQNRNRSIGDYFSPAIRGLFPLVVLSLAVGILAGLGAILLVLPGLWVYAVFSAVVPAIVIERAGFGAMGRSAALTKEYRWPILGTLLVVLILTAVLNFVVTFVLSFVVGIGGSGFFGIIISLIVFGLIYAVSYGLSAVTIALIYARLREIKEGVSVDELAAVFD